MKRLVHSPRLFLGACLFLVLLIPSAPAQAPFKPDLYPDVWELKAIMEMSAMADSEEICTAETGYYVALEALNDISVDATPNPFDWINYAGGTFAILGTEGRFGASRRNFLTSYYKWGGPYVTFQSGTWQTGTTPYDQGSPLDPWGNPYYFFSPLGLLRGDNGLVTLELYGDGFDRYTILSLGWDMVPSADDLVWPFGIGVSVTALTSLRGAGVTVNDPLSPASGFTAPAGRSMRLRGVNLGGPATDAVLKFENRTIDSVTAWTTREIYFTMPADLAGQTGTLKIERGGAARGNPIQVSVYAVPLAAHSWDKYE